MYIDRCHLVTAISFPLNLCLAWKKWFHFLSRLIGNVLQLSVWEGAIYVHLHSKLGISWAVPRTRQYWKGISYWRSHPSSYDAFLRHNFSTNGCIPALMKDAIWKGNITYSRRSGFSPSEIILFRMAITGTPCVGGEILYKTSRHKLVNSTGSFQLIFRKKICIITQWTGMWIDNLTCHQYEPRSE